jgi:putative lipoprotein
MRNSRATNAVMLLIALAMTACRAPQRPPEPAAAPLATPWREARERGIDFRAVGQEPGWYIEIDHERSIRLVWDYMERDATMPAVQPSTTQGRTTYVATNGTQRIDVVIDDRHCNDVMSGAPYPNTVIVTIDGRELRGCGQYLR